MHLHPILADFDAVEEEQEQVCLTSYIGGGVSKLLVEPAQYAQATKSNPCSHGSLSSWLKYAGYLGVEKCSGKKFCFVYDKFGFRMLS